jgi:hypothetical protein
MLILFKHDAHFDLESWCLDFDVHVSWDLENSLLSGKERAICIQTSTYSVP